METQLYEQFQAHYNHHGQVTFEDAARISDSDSRAETKKLFEAFAYKSLPSISPNAQKFFLATSYSDYSSIMVTEAKLAEMIQGGKVDEAALMCLRKPETEQRGVLSLDSATSNQFPVQLEFSHDARIFHQNALTKKMGVKQMPVAAPAAKPAPAVKPATIVSKIPTNSVKSQAPTQPPPGKKSNGFTQQKVMFKTERIEEENKGVDVPMESDPEEAEAKDYPISDEGGDDEEIGTAQGKIVATLDEETVKKLSKRSRARSQSKESEISEKKPAKQRKKRRAVQSSCDEDDDGLDVPEQDAAPEEKDRALQMIQQNNNEPEHGQLRLSDMQTQPSSRPPAAPGKRWARVTRTEQTMDEKGYFVSRDYEEWEEVEDAKKSATLKPKQSTVSETAAKSQGVKKAPSQQPKSQKAGPGVQATMASFFGKK